MQWANFAGKILPRLSGSVAMLCAERLDGAVWHGSCLLHGMPSCQIESGEPSPERPAKEKDEVTSQSEASPKVLKLSQNMRVVSLDSEGEAINEGPTTPKSTERQLFYISFGQDHKLVLHDKVLDEDCLMELCVSNYQMAYDLAYKLTKGKFCTVYTTEDLNEVLPFFPNGVVAI